MRKPRQKHAIVKIENRNIRTLIKIRARIAVINREGRYIEVANCYYSPPSL